MSIANWKRKALGWHPMGGDGGGGGGGGGDIGLERGDTAGGAGSNLSGSGPAGSPDFSGLADFASIGGAPAAPSAPARAEIATPEDPGSGKGLVAGAMAPAAPAALSELTPTDVKSHSPVANVVANPQVPSTGKMIDLSMPTPGSVVTGVTGSKTLGGLANMVAGPVSAVTNGINFAINAINEVAGLRGQSAPQTGDFSTTDTINGQPSGFNRDGTSSGGGTSNSGPDSGNRGGPDSYAGGGLINNAINGGQPATPATPATPASSVALNGRMFRRGSMAGWSSAGRKFARAKQANRQGALA